ncbi:MAG: hypothetical protein ACLFTK_06045 [Anaerolineales bacterium]
MEPAIIFGQRVTYQQWDALAFFEDFDIPFEAIDVNDNARASEWLCEILGREALLPAVRLPSGDIYERPSYAALAEYYGITLQDLAQTADSQLNPILIFGTEWSIDTIQICQLLKNAGLRFKYVDIEHNERALAWIKSRSPGQFVIPVVQLPNGELIVGPTRHDIAEIFGIHTRTETCRPDTKPLPPLEEALNDPRRAASSSA